ncbi:hypothetical protein HOLDEFILI_01891 [Holdemania filiformis DSM 12042]|uniref:Uncharacterized protein n=1 Tax=Holdemania filiformis DSM 12042 TaxID=545696 RepID=B9Y7U6_9FIRM|nr:hypothetical protein HOLDEFILI_01891 [Holdemania filiformis DSM 12042]
MPRTFPVSFFDLPIVRHSDLPCFTENTLSSSSVRVLINF